jgi:hypothetical protein
MGALAISDPLRFSGASQSHACGKNQERGAAVAVCGLRIFDAFSTFLSPGVAAHVVKGLRRVMRPLSMFCLRVALPACLPVFLLLVYLSACLLTVSSLALMVCLMLTHHAGLHSMCTMVAKHPEM